MPVMMTSGWAFRSDEDRGEITGVRIEANMIEHLQAGFRQAFEIACVEGRGPGGILAHHYCGLQMERSDQHVFGVVADTCASTWT